MLYGTLKLKINAQKSAVAEATGRKFLGYELWRNGKGEIKRATTKQATSALQAPDWAGHAAQCRTLDGSGD